MVHLPTSGAFCDVPPPSRLKRNRLFVTSLPNDLNDSTWGAHLCVLSLPKVLVAFILIEPVIQMNDTMTDKGHTVVSRDEACLGFEQSDDDAAGGVEVSPATASHKGDFTVQYVQLM